MQVPYIKCYQLSPWRKLNLSKIESRPMKTGLGNYFFLIDVDKAYDDVLLPGVTMELEALGFSVTVLEELFFLLVVGCQMEYLYLPNRPYHFIA